MHADRIILVDDDSINNMLSSYVIGTVRPNIAIVDFTNPTNALNYVMSKLEEDKTSIVLLDIRMPELDGWQFLDKLHPYVDQVKKHFRIYVLSSTIDPLDLKKAREHELVSGFFEKPLTSINMSSLLDPMPA